MAVCPDCGKIFSRHFNMIRHKALKHSTVFDDEDSDHEMDESSQETVITDNENESDTGEGYESGEEDATEDENMDTDEISDVKDDSEKYDLWIYLVEEAENSEYISTKEVSSFH